MTRDLESSALPRCSSVDLQTHRTYAYLTDLYVGVDESETYIKPKRLLLLQNLFRLAIDLFLVRWAQLARILHL